MKKVSAKSALIAALVAKKAQENALRGVHCVGHCIGSDQI